MRRIAYNIFALVLMATATLTASAQIDEIRQVSGFNGIGSGGPFNVHVKIDGTESIKLVGKAEIINEIETIVQDGKLWIQWKKQWKEHKEAEGEKIDIYVTAKSLSAVGNAGTGSITIDGVVTGDSVNIQQAGPCSITCTVKTPNIHVAVSGSGVVSLSGNADFAKIELTGTNTLNAKKLKIGTAQVYAVGSPNAFLTADKTISAKLVGAGNIAYSGDATIGEVKSVGSGTLHKE